MVDSDVDALRNVCVSKCLVHDLAPLCRYSRVLQQMMYARDAEKLAVSVLEIYEDV
jgi:hypothetical protein